MFDIGGRRHDGPVMFVNGGEASPILQYTSNRLTSFARWRLREIPRVSVGGFRGGRPALEDRKGRGKHGKNKNRMH